MLKKYLQALLEAFIGSKKEWVTTQLAGNHSSISVSCKINKGANFIAPCNGWLHVEAQGSSGEGIRTYVNIVTDTPNGSWRSCVSSDNSGGITASQIFVRKGDAHKIYTSGKTLVVCHFIPCIGSV